MKSNLNKDGNNASVLVPPSAKGSPQSLKVPSSPNIDDYRAEVRSQGIDPEIRGIIEKFGLAKEFDRLPDARKQIILKNISEHKDFLQTDAAVDVKNQVEELLGGELSWFTPLKGFDVIISLYLGSEDKNNVSQETFEEVSRLKTFLVSLKGEPYNIRLNEAEFSSMLRHYADRSKGLSRLGFGRLELDSEDPSKLVSTLQRPEVKTLFSWSKTNYLRQQLTTDMSGIVRFIRLVAVLDSLGWSDVPLENQVAAIAKMAELTSMRKFDSELAWSIFHGLKNSHIKYPQLIEAVNDPSVILTRLDLEREFPTFEIPGPADEWANFIVLATDSEKRKRFVDFHTSLTPLVKGLPKDQKLSFDYSIFDKEIYERKKFLIDLVDKNPDLRDDKDPMLSFNEAENCSANAWRAFIEGEGEVPELIEGMKRWGVDKIDVDRLLTFFGSGAKDDESFQQIAEQLKSVRNLIKDPDVPKTIDSFFEQLEISLGGASDQNRRAGWLKEAVKGGLGDRDPLQLLEIKNFLDNYQQLTTNVDLLSKGFLDRSRLNPHYSYLNLFLLKKLINVSRHPFFGEPSAMREVFNTLETTFSLDHPLMRFVPQDAKSASKFAEWIGRDDIREGWRSFLAEKNFTRESSSYWLDYYFAFKEYVGRYQESENGIKQ